MIAGSPKSSLSSPFLFRWRACCCTGYSSSVISVSPSFFNPKFMRRTLLGWLLSFVMAALVIGTVEANAKEGSKDELHAKLETFTVNLSGPTQKYLQVDITLSLANVQAVESIKTYMPEIRHKMILLLTSKEASILVTNEGKKKLLQEAKKAANSVIHVTEKEGVADVLFTSFIIQ